MEVRDRFWAKVDKSGDCWLWTGAKNADGYGSFRYRGSSVNAYRVAYLLTYGDIAEGLNVCHRCDVRLCCNPAHLFLGTQLDNIADMDRKGRRGAARGEQHGTAKLSDREVAEIRRLYAAGGRSTRELGRQFNVHYSYVARLIRGKKRQSLTLSTEKTEYTEPVATESSQSENIGGTP